MNQQILGSKGSAPSPLPTIEGANKSVVYELLNFLAKKTKLPLDEGGSIALRESSFPGDPLVPPGIPSSLHTHLTRSHEFLSLPFVFRFNTFAPMDTYCI